MNKNKDIVLGADPEIFVETGKGKNMPAFTFLPDKWNPKKTEEGQNVYWDGFQAEFNINASDDIAKCRDSIRLGLKAVKDAACLKDPKAKLSTKTVIETPVKELEKLPRELTEFGCMPSYNIYDIAGEGGEGKDVPYRFAGGHIHFGIADRPEYMKKIPQIVEALDATLGVICVSLYRNYDNPVRRRWYGLAGEHRLPPHGLEYRTLSDAWIFHPKTVEVMFDLARKVVVATVEGKNEWVADRGEVISCILQSDVKTAIKIIQANNGKLEKMGFTTDLDFTKSVDSQLNINNIENNWQI